LPVSVTIFLIEPRIKSLYLFVNLILVERLLLLIIIVLQILPSNFSYFLSYGTDKRSRIIEKLSQSGRIVEVLAFCLMPNHFHLLVKQLKDGGISRYLSLFQNSFAKYRNTKYQREGHLFGGQFKVVRIEDDDQFLHVHRYIHLNPYTSLVVRNFDELENYSYSSLPEYLGIEEGFCHKEEVLAHFKDLTMYRNLF